MKMKTRKAVAKKVKVTKNKKVIRRQTGNNHGNAKEPGKVTRSKRHDQRLFKTDEANMLRALPYV